MENASMERRDQTKEVFREDEEEEEETMVPEAAPAGEKRRRALHLSCSCPQSGLPITVFLAF